MKNKRVVIICLLSILLVLFLSLVLTGWFSDFWEKITGKVSSNQNLTRPPQQTPQQMMKCIDSDGGLNYSIRGNAVIYESRVRSGKNETSLRQNRTDTCEDSTTLNEQFCSSNSTASSISYDCPYGCADGVCISQEMLQACGSSVPMNSSICKNVAQVYPTDPVSTPELKNVKLTNLDDSGYLRGKYVRVVIPCVVKTGTTLCMSPPGPPVYSPNHTFMFKPINYSASGYFKPDYQGQHFDEVTLYYGVNLAAEWFDKTLGLKNAKRISVVAYNQAIPGDRVEAARGDDGTPIINFPAKPSGKANPYLYVRGMFHEVTHMVFVETIKNNDNGYVYNNVNGAKDPSASSMNEGYAIYFPCSYYNSTHDSYSSHPMDIDFDYNYTHVSTSYFYSTTSRSIEVANMNAFAGALWDVRKEIGPEVLDPMIVKSWRIMPVQKSGDFVVDAMAALVQADKQMHNGAHKQIIVSAFAKHNIICKTCK